jgi:hypothetical protein
MSARPALILLTTAVASIGVVISVHVIQQRDSDRMFESVRQEIAREEATAAAAHSTAIASTTK